MPFTISHVVAILPLTTPRPARWFSPRRWSSGRWCPMFRCWRPTWALTPGPTTSLGPITYDLVVGLVVFALWTFALRRPLTDLAPHGLRARLSPAQPVRGRAWLWAGVALVVGAYTHVMWDSFTHANRWGTNISPPERVPGPLPGFKWLQHGCGILGLLFLAWWLARWWRRTPPHAVPPAAARRGSVVCRSGPAAGAVVRLRRRRAVQWASAGLRGGLPDHARSA